MSANYINSPIGLMTYFDDDSLYNFVKNMYTSSIVYLYNKGVKQEANYNTFVNNIPLDKFYFALQNYGDTKISEDFYNVFSEIFPHMQFHNSTEVTEYSFYNNDDKKFKMEISGTSIVHFMKIPLLYEGNTIYGYDGSSNRGFFYGHILKENSSDDYVSRAYFSIPFFNSDYTNFAILFITAIWNNSFKSLYVRRGNLASSSQNNIYLNYFKTMNSDPRPPKKDTDPYSEGGNTTTGGGTGTFDGTSTPVSIPNLPTLSAVDTGFITLFNPTLSEMKNLANYMWSDLFDLDGWKKIFADPMNAILGLSLVPVSVPDGGQKTVTVGNISTGVSMNKAGSQFVTVDCGSIEVKEYWGSYLDYAPFTKSELYLPYCGTHPIDIDDIMGKTIHVAYHVDILSGACCAYVQCGESVLYTFVGQCSVSIPITGNDWTNVVNGALTIGASIGTMVATGGASAPMATQTIASTAVNSLKPSVEKSGALSGMGGMLANQTPYLIITLPRQAVPENQNTFMGYPSFVTVTLSECSGYTEVDRIHLENVNATDKELDEIELLLKSGVII